MVDKDGVVSILSPGPLLNDLSSDAALKNPLKGLMLSGMQLLLNAREEDLARCGVQDSNKDLKS